MKWYQNIVAKVGMDKIAHFAVSAFLTLAVGRFLHWAIAAVVTIVLGFAKELLDGNINGRDLIADLTGVVIASIILII